MNYIGHALVASEVMPNVNDTQIFGSMAPDLVGMTGARIVRHVENTDLAEGVEFHIATDQVFDRNSVFTGLKIKFRELHEQFLPKGAARACANVGTEMLLDGFVLQKSQAVDVYSDAMEAARRGLIPVSQVSSDPARFAKFNEGYAKIGVPYSYQDPFWVADRLQRRLSIRNSPRLKFDEAKVPEVAKLFEFQQEEIGKVANLLLEQTIVELRQGYLNNQNINIGPVMVLLPGLAIATARQNRYDTELLTPNELESMATSQISPATASGRKLAKMALRQLGFDKQPEILRGIRGEPIFPDGFIGSISHSAGWVIALASRNDEYLSIGVDIEPSDRVFRHDISHRIASDEELEDFSDFNEHTPLIISSLKEAVYKAIHPYVRRRVGFGEVSLNRISQDRAKVQLLDKRLQELSTYDIEIIMVRDANWQSSLCIIRK